MAEWIDWDSLLQEIQEQHPRLDDLSCGHSNDVVHTFRCEIAGCDGAVLMCEHLLCTNATCGVPDDIPHPPGWPIFDGRVAHDWRVFYACPRHTLDEVNAAVEAARTREQEAHDGPATE